MTQVDPLRELIARSCRILGKLNLTKEPSGHVSARIPGEDRILTKARGPEESGLRFATERDIITVDFEGKKRAGSDGLEAPQEVFIHTWLYRSGGSEAKSRNPGLQSAGALGFALSERS